MDRTLRIVYASLPVLGVLALIGMAQVMPGYFRNQQYLAGLILLEALVLCMMFYERMFFPFVMLAFLWAGMNVPGSEAWTQARWGVLAFAAFFGFLRSVKLGRQSYSTFHLVALSCVASALVSAMVSELPGFTLLKVLSLFLLFLYAMSGVRLILQDRDRFVRGLLLACEINVYLTLVAYLGLHLEVWGNTNSLGAIEGVVAVPVLLWGTLVAPERKLKLRWAIACLLALYLIYFSVARAAMLACAISTLVLLVGLRQQRLIMRGLVGITCLIAITAIAAPRRLDEWKQSIKGDVIYKGHFEQGLLGSRLTPWQETTKVIQESPLFGSGFGTSISGEKSFGEGANFRSNAGTNREHGSSYLTITEWVGLLGILPFVLLLILITHAIAKVFLWIRQTRSASHYAVPLMLVLVAGLVHAFFEDWLFAVGFYLTVLFWSFAFLLMDLLPEMVIYRTRLVHGMRFRYPATTAAVRH